jgi:hypothetical protein
MVLFLPHKLAINDLVPLIAHKPVERLDDRVEIETLRDRFHSVLALGTTVIVVCALENETECFRNEADIASFSPAKQVEGDLTETIVLAHVVHGISPTIKSTVQGLCAFILGALDGFQTLQPGVLCMANGVVQI